MRWTFALCLVLFASTAFGQNIVGTWHEGDTLIGSMYRARYVFGADKVFAYHSSQYDGLQRIQTIGGRYRLVGNIIYLTPEYTVEMRDGTLERSHFTTLNDSWSIEGGHFKTYKIAKPVQQSAQIKVVQRKKGRCLLLDLQPYYKITPAN